jgi:CRP-like cAMP-binding protein
VARIDEDLKQVWLFEDLSQRQLKRLGRHFRERKFRPGTAMVRQGEMSGVDFFVIVEGEAAVVVDGKEVGQLGPGDHFGELALIAEQVRAATVTAKTPLRCLVMASWDLRRFVKDDPDTGWKLLQHVVRALLEELKTGPHAFRARPKTTR